MYEVLLEKNGYLLVKYNDEDGETLYSYGTPYCLDLEKKEPFRGTRVEMLKSCNYSIRHCNRKLKKYKSKKMDTIIEMLEKQKEALYEIKKELEAIE